MSDGRGCVPGTDRFIHTIKSNKVPGDLPSHIKKVVRLFRGFEPAEGWDKMAAIREGEKPPCNTDYLMKNRNTMPRCLNC